MKYNDLEVNKNTRPTRKGRGISAGQGKTAGRGTKGQKSRTGHRKMPAGFMGGFKNEDIELITPTEKFVTQVTEIKDLKGDVDNFKLYEKSLIKSPYNKVKVITRGELTSAINLKTQFASKTAIEAIKKAGGKFEKVAVPSRTTREDSRKGSK